IAIYNAGAGTNSSPATTTITTTGTTYTETSSNYNWSAVTVAIDPTATIFDLNGDGKTDQFLSFTVNFQDVVNRLAAVGLDGVNPESAAPLGGRHTARPPHADPGHRGPERRDRLGEQLDAPRRVLDPLRRSRRSRAGDRAPDGPRARRPRRAPAERLAASEA